MNLLYKALLYMLFFSRFLYCAAASSSFQLSDCFDSKRLIVPNETRMYHPFLMEHWFRSSTARFQKSEVKLFIGVGIFSGPDAAVLETARQTAFTLVRTCTKEEEIMRICAYDYLLQQVHIKLIEQHIPEPVARQVQMSYSTFIHSRDFIQQATNLIVPHGMEQALTPNDLAVDDFSLLKNAREFIALAARLATQADHTHEAIIVVPRPTTYTAYVKQRFATRLPS